MTVAEATDLCLKVMSKTMDTTKLGSEKRKSLYFILWVFFSFLFFFLNLTSNLPLPHCLRENSRVGIIDVELNDQATFRQDLFWGRGRFDPAASRAGRYEGGDGRRWRGNGWWIEWRYRDGDLKERVVYALVDILFFVSCFSLF